MTISAVRYSINRPAVAALWGLTLIALIPFPSLTYVLLGAAASLAANGIALYLLCSRSRLDRAHGFTRLALQVAILVVGAIALVRCGVTLPGLLHFISHQTR
jgi:predicted Kef-type K+ transport protein